MPADAGALRRALADPPIALEPLAEAHRAALRAACAADPDIWEIYPVSLTGAHFDPQFEAMLAAPARFAILHEGQLVGTTSFLNIDAPNATTDIGGTYLAPTARGGALNGRVKALMIGHAFASGFTRIVFRIDTRNTRSMRAVEKLGAKREGTLRRDRVTWTGHVRDTAVYAILAGEWQ